MTRLRGDRRGHVALMFAVSAITILTGIGAGVDLLRAYAAQQKLSEVASLACQYATRPSVIGAAVATVDNATGALTQSSDSAYVGTVTSYLNTALASQGFQYMQTNGMPFSYVANGAANVSISASVPTTFMKIVGASSIAVSAASHCFDTPGSISTPLANGNNPVIAEGFETNATHIDNSFTWTLPNGQLAQPGQAIPLTSGLPSTPGYTGSSGSQWYIMGYCLEVDTVGTILSSAPQGTRSAELDCDNGAGTAGNSSVSTKVYLAAGNYELRYNFAARVDYPDYNPVTICGSTAADISWANDTNSAGAPVSNALRNNQINVYLDRDTAGTPPLHATLDNEEQLAGGDMIDTCVYAPGWIQRSVRIKVTAPDYYWLSFASDGQNDSYGGQLDNLMLCQNNCVGSVQDSFPSAWLAANNGGSNRVLFEDNFSELATTGTSSGTLAIADGTSGTSASGWPNQSPSGWATAPVNQVTYGTSGGPLLLNGFVVAAGTTASNGSSSRLFSRPFLLDPGYYSLTWYYRSNVDFATAPAISCGATPAAAGLSTATGSARATIRNTAISGTYPLNINTVGVFISSGQMVSTPNGGTSFTNPDSNLADTPPVPGGTFIAPDAISLTNYTPSTTSALLDICGYASDWTARTVNFEIRKTGQYWLTFSSHMATTGGSGSGGGIGDVKLTALGSPAMTSPPSNPVVVPSPGTQPGATISYNGYFIVADPLTVPAPLQ